MHYTEGPGNVSGLFVDVDVKNLVHPTVIDSDWLNTVQKEIANAVLCAGLPLKTKATETFNQLAKAVRYCIGTQTFGAQQFRNMNTSGAYTRPTDHIGDLMVPGALCAPCYGILDLTPHLKPNTVIHEATIFGSTGAGDGVVTATIVQVNEITGATTLVTTATISGGVKTDTATPDYIVLAGLRYFMKISLLANTLAANATFYGAKIVTTL